MAMLMIDRVRCKEESDEAGADDVYVVVFRGNTAAPFNSNVAVHGPGEFWDDFDTDDARNIDVPIAKWRTDAVYVVMLVEEDNSRDISGNEVIGAWKAQAALAWQAAMISLHASAGVPLTSPLPEAQRQAAAAGIVDVMEGLASIYMSFPKGNDDILGRPQRIPIKAGQPVTIDYVSPPAKEDARYRITFKVA